MPVTELLQSVRFVVGNEGKPTDAVIAIDVWNELVEWLEDLEDAQLVRDGLAKVRAAGSPEAAGLVPWSQITAELDALDQAEEADYARLKSEWKPLVSASVRRTDGSI